MRAKVPGGAAPAVLVILALAWGASADNSWAGRSEGPLRAYLADDRSVPGWTRDGEPQEFEGENLYTYIDGGAEIYEEYGFARVIVQDYKSAKDRSASLEIFEMASPAAAFGMFTFKRSGQGENLALGGGAELESYYLNFWKGRFLVTLTGFDEAVETVNGLVALGRAIEAKLPGGAELPALVAALPRDGLEPRSVKYLRGLLGLGNVYSFYTARGLSFKDAVRGLYESGESLILLDYGSGEARQAAWSDLQAFLGSSDRFRPLGTEPGKTTVVVDGKGRFLAFRENGPRLAVGIASSAAAAAEAANRVR